MALSARARAFLDTGYIARTPRARAIGSANPAPHVPIEAYAPLAASRNEREAFLDREVAYRNQLAGTPRYDDEGRPVGRNEPVDFGPKIRVLVSGEAKPVEDYLSAIQRDYPDHEESHHRGDALLSTGVSPAQIDIIYAE